MMKWLAISFMALTVGLVFCPNARATQATLRFMVAQAPTPTPSYIPWYTSPPSPIPSANAAINASFGAGNIYNTGSAGNESSGINVLNTGGCYFLCFGAPGVASHHVLAYGNDYQTPGPMVTGSFTTQGAPDDCASSCPGDVANQIYSVTLQSNPSVNNGYIIAADGKGNFGVYNNIVAGAAGLSLAQATARPGLRRIPDR